jgi:hypothetical protein
MKGTNIRRQAGSSQSLAPQARTATANGASVDLAGYLSAIVVLLVGTITDGTHTPKLQESNDNASWTDVGAGDLEGSFANLASSTQQIVGYKGQKRFVRPVVTVAGATTGGVYGAAMLRGGAQQEPAS